MVENVLVFHYSCAVNGECRQLDCVSVTEPITLILKRFPCEDSGLNAQALCIKSGYGCASEANYVLPVLSDTYRSSLGPLQERLDLQIAC